MRARLIASAFVALLSTTACNVLLPPAPGDVILTGPPAAARKVYKPLIESFTAEPSNLVPRGTHGEIAEVLRGAYGGIASDVALPLPTDPSQDDALRSVIGSLRSGP